MTEPTIYREYSVENQQGANLRIGPATSAGILTDRKATQGTKLSVTGIVKTNAGRDRWLLLTEIDPKTQEVWRYNGQETSVYVALYVNGTHYCKPVESSAVIPSTPGPGNVSEFDRGWNARGVADAQAVALAIEELKK